ncbi:MAG: hypothetical protein JSS02_34030 [Planctomycetes bacterium]|nr:hypothetical protein [Planctomycetota bacterium]
MGTASTVQAWRRVFQQRFRFAKEDLGDQQVVVAFSGGGVQAVDDLLDFHESLSGGFWVFPFMLSPSAKAPIRGVTHPIRRYSLDFATNLTADSASPPRKAPQDAGRQSLRYSQSVPVQFSMN